jgi:hypothetical protein
VATEVHPAKKIYPGRGDPIRIVPLSLPDAVHRPTPEAAAAGAAAAPRLTYRNGPLLEAVEVFTIFWGTDWQSAGNAALSSQINQFFDYILTSALIDQLSEYNVPGWTDPEKTARPGRRPKQNGNGGQRGERAPLRVEGGPGRRGEGGAAPTYRH